MPEPTPKQGPAELVAIARAAHLAGDRNLKKTAIDQLKDRFGISIKFPNKEKLETRK